VARGGGVSIPIDGDVSGLNRALTTAENSLGAFGTRQAALADKMGAAGRTLTRNLTLPIVGAGIAAGKLAYDFNTSLTRVNALVGVSAKQTNAWGKQMLELAPKVGKSPRELADALYFVTSSGIETSKVMDALTVSAKLSATGLGETEAIADGLTSAINAYANENLTAARAGDIFTATVKEGKAEAASLAPVLGNVLPVAQQFGIRFDEVGASVAAMTLKGTTAETAVTNLSGIFSAFLKPGTQAKNTLKEFNLTSDGVRQSLREKGLIATLRDLRQTFGDNHEAMGKVLPDVRALRGFLQLTGGDAAAVDRIFKNVKNSTGDAGKAFRDTAETDGFKLEQALARLQAQGIKVGDTLLPVAADVAAGFGKMLDRFDELPGGAKKAVAAGAIIAAGLGPALRVAEGITRGIGGLATLGGKIGLGTTTASTVGGLNGAVGSRVFVTNWPPGMLAPGGRGGPTGLVPTIAKGAPGVAIPGIGAGVGAGALGAGAFLGIGAAAIGGGIVLNKLDDKFGLLGPSKAEGKKAADTLRNSMIQAFRQGQPELERVLQKGMVVDAAPLATQIKAETRIAMSEFSKGIKAGEPNAKRTTKQVVTSALGEIGKMSPQARRYGADSMLQMSAALESQGKAPVGTTKRLLNALEKQLGRLPSATRANVGAAMTSVQAFATALSSINAAADSAASAVESFAARAKAAASNPPSWGPGWFAPSSGPGGGGPPGKKPPSKGGQGADEFGAGVYKLDAKGDLVAVRPRRGEARAISFADRTSQIISARHRDDSLQDSQTRAAVLGDPAKVGGISNPDKLTAIGDKAVAEVRKQELEDDAKNVQTARNKVRRAILGRRATLEKKIAERSKVPRKVAGKSKGSKVDNPKYKALTAEIKRLRESIADLWDQDRDYRRQYAEIQAEADELGFTISQLDMAITAMPSVIPDAPADTDTTSAATAASTADETARADQAEAARQDAVRESQALGAYVEALRGSGGIDPALGTTVVQYVMGGLVQDAWAGSWITDALQRQGVPSSGYVRSPV